MSASAANERTPREGGRRRRDRERPEQERERPWYRQLWPWLLMLPPALSVAGGVTMVVLATHTPNALVVDDYARIEALTSERFDRDRQAARLGLKAVLTFAAAPARVEVSLAGPASFAPPRELRLRLRHATNPAADRELALVRAGDRYTTGADLLPGRYRLELMPQDNVWRLGGEAPRLEGAITLVPQAEPEPQAKVEDTAVRGEPGTFAQAQAGTEPGRSGEVRAFAAPGTSGV